MNTIPIPIPNMASSSNNKKSHNRSVSLPARSHPSTIKIEQLVNKIKSLDSSSSSSCSLRAEKIINSLYGLKELYQSIDQFLALPLINQRSSSALSQSDHGKKINELLDESVKYIDICSSSRDKIMLMKEAIRGLQSSFRRSKIGDLRIDEEISVFMSSRKNIHKEILSISKALFKLKNRDFLKLDYFSNSSSEDQFKIVIRYIIEANFLTISCFSSLLLFLSGPVLKKSKGSKWSLVVSKLISSNYEVERRDALNEVENVDIALNNLMNLGDCGREKIEFAQRKLEGLELIMENLENGLEVLFRHLIRTRVSLLNTFSQ
ncbi:hypothetical protein M9H77_05270 [Catharanthus roseus]|uniref:Uncharacterized protein n=1 Tax=Catharanthus roseus TaxID=4058 RepID=A0ACC0CGT0_CATRO|nr:hypothetical protein M9H77_05270 [Catharanthus roseus]